MSKLALNAGMPTHKQGLIFVKENIDKSHTSIDEEDNSLMRTHKHWLLLFEGAGLEVLLDTVQENMPEDLNEIRIFILCRK